MNKEILFCLSKAYLKGFTEKYFLFYKNKSLLKSQNFDVLTLTGTNFLKASLRNYS